MIAATVPQPAGAPPKEPNVAKRTDSLYYIMQSIETRLGGGEGVQGVYGSVTQTGTQQIFSCLQHSTGFDSKSILVDIGAGLGRPLMHALVNPGIADGFGIEVDDIKVQKADAFIRQTCQELERRGLAPADLPRPKVACMPIEKVTSLDPATHAYTFWEGIPMDARACFGELFAKSRTLRAVAVVQRAMRGEAPAAVMRSLGFGPLLLLRNFAVSMSGSGRRFQAYVFSKISPDSNLFLHQALAGPRGQLLPAAGSDDSSASVLGAPLPAGSVLTAPSAGSEDEEDGSGEKEVVQQVAGKSAGNAATPEEGSPNKKQRQQEQGQEQQDDKQQQEQEQQDDKQQQEQEQQDDKQEQGQAKKAGAAGGAMKQTAITASYPQRAKRLDFSGKPAAAAGKPLAAGKAAAAPAAPAAAAPQQDKEATPAEERSAAGKAAAGSAAGKAAGKAKQPAAASKPARQQAQQAPAAAASEPSSSSQRSSARLRARKDAAGKEGSSSADV